MAESGYQKGVPKITQLDEFLSEVRSPQPVIEPYPNDYTKNKRCLYNENLSNV
jgi:hypothetical protein